VSGKWFQKEAKAFLGELRALGLKSRCLTSPIARGLMLDPACGCPP